MNNFWKDRNVLITGGTGLLGSELTSQLVDLGTNLTLIVRDRAFRSPVFNAGLFDKVNSVFGDVTDFALVLRVLNEYEIDTVFHLAAQTIVGIANLSPLSTFDSNIRGTWNVLEAARLSHKIRSVVVASSDKAYGDHEVLPYDEKAPLKGNHPYDVSKSCTDLLAQTYWHTYKLPVSITRCGNLFGGGDLNFSRIIPGTIRSLLRNEPPILRSNGQFIRNYFYIKDAVNGYLCISEQMEKSSGEAFNLATEDRFTVLEMTNLIIRLMNSTLQPLIKNETKNEIPDQYLGVSKVKEVLGWKSRYSIEEALTETIEWYRQYLSFSQV